MERRMEILLVKQFLQLRYVRVATRCMRVEYRRKVLSVRYNFSNSRRCVSPRLSPLFRFLCLPKGLLHLCSSARRSSNSSSTMFSLLFFLVFFILLSSPLFNKLLFIKTRCGSLLLL